MSCPLITFVILMTALTPLIVKSHSPCNGEKVPEVYTLASVKTCPTGKERRQKENSCHISNNKFHCLPDRDGNLYTFCGISKRYLRYSYFVADNNGTLRLTNLGFTISPGTATELYSNLSQVIVNAPDSLDNFPIFEQLKEELDFTATDACKHNLKNYALPSRDSCNIINICAVPKYVPCINIYVLNVSNGHGSIIEREFPLPKTNEKKYAMIALVLCRIYRSTLREQCSATQGHISSTIQTSIYPKDTVTTETQICQICYNTICIITIVVLVIIIVVLIVILIEMKFHFIEKQYLKRRQRSSEKGEYAQPSDAYDTSHQSKVELSTN